jgi:ferredoxin
VARGGNADRIHFELFNAPPIEETSLDTAEVRFERSGLTAQWTAEEDLTLLDVAERAGVSVPSDCRAGTCLTCRSKILNGTMTASLEDGYGLLCIGRPKTARLVLDC